MQVYIGLLFICFFISLFGLYVFSKDDFIFLRKNISLEYIFNIAFITLGVGVLFGRIGYVILHPSKQYLNPLVFLLFPYFPGISISFSIVGVVLYLFFLTRKKKLPMGRIFDIFSLSFLLSLPFAHFFFLLTPVLIKKPILWWESIFVLLYTLGFAGVLLLFFRAKLKDGEICSLILLFFSSSAVLYELFIKSKRIIWFLSLEDFIFILIGIFSIYVFLHLARISSRVIKKK